ncbi:MAG: hypothetical protein HYY11_04665 [Candidatus Methylomirabilis oxyfera]|nr:hypothetical protein [Candidatus Methylomirabilis oxyfera]
MSDTTGEQDLTAEKRRLLAETRADLLKRQLSNAENYDKAVLSLSTAFLGFSLAFLKDLIPSQRAEWLSLLYGSWIILTAAVLSTIVSFWVSQHAINVQLEKAEAYYLRDDHAALKRSWIAKATDWVNWASGGFFFLGVSLATAFVIVNFEGGLKMGSDQKSEQVRKTYGATIPKMQAVEVKKGAPIPNIQPAPRNQPAQSQPTAQGNPVAPPANSAPRGSKRN